MTIGLPDIPDDLKNLQVDPTHAASVIASIFGAIAPPDTGQNAGLPSTSQAPTATPANPTSAATPTETSAPGGTAFPIEGGNAPINEGFGAPTPGGPHPGIDFGVPVGSHAVAMMDGTITQAGLTDPGGYGNLVEITTANGVQIRYGHLSGIAVHVGETVHAGQSLGETGGAKGATGSGNSTGPHLHFEMDQNGHPIDPTPFLAGGASVVGMPDTSSGATTADPKPLSPEQIISAQLANVVDTVEGNTPSHTVTQPTTATKTPNQATGQPGAPSGNWAQDILAGIGAPVTPETLAAVEAWMRYEGGAVHNNPMNTTLAMPGATNWNDIGVKTYTDYEQGLVATIRTLLQSNMAPVVAALRAGADKNKLSAAVGQTPWNNYTPFTV